MIGVNLEPNLWENYCEIMMGVVLYSYKEEGTISADDLEKELEL